MEIVYKQDLCHNDLVWVLQAMQGQYHIVVARVLQEVCKRYTIVIWHIMCIYAELRPVLFGMVIARGKVRDIRSVEFTNSPGS